MQPKENYFSKQVTDARQILIGIPKGTEEELNVVSVGCERCLPEFLVDRKTFPRNPNQPETDVMIPRRAVVKFKAGKEMKNGLEKLDLDQIS